MKSISRIRKPLAPLAISVLLIVLVGCNYLIEDNIAQIVSTNDSLTKVAETGAETPTSTQTPSLTNVFTYTVTNTVGPTLTSTATSTPSQNSSPFCDSRDQPGFPCLWKILPDNLITNTQSDNFVSVAIRALR